MAETRYPSVYIDRLGRQLTLWEKYGLSATHSMRLLRLWLGYKLTNLMDTKGRYTFHSFNQLRQIVGYRSIQEMIADIKISKSFVLLSCDIDTTLLKDHTIFTPCRPEREYQNHVTAFFSPYWHKWEKTDGNVLPGSIDECCKCNCKCNDIDNNTLDNKTLSGGTAEAEAAGLPAAMELAEEALTIEQVEAIEQLELKQQIREVKLYFRKLASNEDKRQHEPIEWLMMRLTQPVNPPPGKMKGYGLSHDEASQALEVLIDSELAQHFARDKNFMAPDRIAKPENRIYQVTNYIKKYSGPMLKNAVKRWKKRAAERQREQERRAEELEKLNRPLSPHEWQDREGIRWMEDSRGNVMRVPDQAPPRPSADAMWNYLDGKWGKVNEK